MKSNIGSLIKASLVGLSSMAMFSMPSHAQTTSKFYCDTNGGEPTTMIRTKQGYIPMISWSEVNNVGSKSTLERCKIISNRFQSYYIKGNFFLAAKKNVNGHPVICAVNQVGGKCTDKNVLITLPKGFNANDVLTQISSFRRGATPESVKLAAEASKSYSDGELHIDIEKLSKSLDEADPLF